MPLMFWIDIIAFSISIVLSTALTLLVFSINPKHALNWSFGCFTFVSAMWALFALLLRVSLVFNIGNPILLSELTTLSVGLLGPTLFIFIAYYVKRPTHRIILFAGAGIIINILFTIPLFQHQLVINPVLNNNGLAAITITGLGMVTLAVLGLYLFFSLLLLWQQRDQLTEYYVAASVIILLLGLILGGTLSPPFPILSITNTFSMVFLGYAVIRLNLFNPLKQKTDALEREITERRRVESILRNEHTFRNLIIKGAAEGLCVCHDTIEHPHIEFTVWNDRMSEITGYSMNEINKCGWYQTVYPDPELQAQAKARMERMRYGDDLHAEPWEITRADGEKRIIDITTSVIIDEDGTPHVLALMDDITKKKRAEEALRASEEKFRTLVDSMDDIVYMLDKEQRHTGVFGRWLENESVTEDMFLGKTAGEIMGPEAAVPHEVANKRALSGESVLYDWQIQDPAGINYYQTSVSPLKDANDQIIGIVGVGRNITRDKQAEEAILKTSRLETAATLAGGIAHKVNNLMTSVLGYADILKTEFTETKYAQEMLTIIADSAQETGHLAQQMLAFARGGKYQPQVINVNETIREILQFQQRSVPTDIQIKQNFAADLWPVEADPNQFSEIIINLFTNAIEAIDTSGRIEVTTANLLVNETTAQTYPDFEIGPYIYLSIRDDGRGMDVQTLDRIFEPFFTTKFQGRGMGLAATYGIVNNHNGHILVNSEPEKGTTFKIYLPAVHARTTPAMMLETPEDTSAVAQAHKKQTIMIVEDDNTVQTVLNEMLKSLGYQTLLADNGQQAIDIAQSYSGEIHLTLLDLGMPVMNGTTAFPSLTAARPHMKIILCSGYELDTATRTILDNNDMRFIQKPIQFKTLETEIQKALHSTSQ